MLQFILVLVMTHITIVCVTVFLHRGQAHKSLEFHPITSHFMRFWLWMTTGMVTKEWVAIHRKHHGFTDKPDDPHSPVVYGIWRVLFGGVWLYVQSSRDQEMIRRFGTGTPNDWMENNIYTPYSKVGIVALLILETALFNGWGIVMWLIQMAWIPFWAAGVVNGLGHWWGYRNGKTNDHSHNISPWGIVIGGEELHNNHHIAPANPKLSVKWWEFDLGWFYIRVLEQLRLLRIVHR